jgi:octaprenyl-diphosphate synthase
LGPINSRTLSAGMVVELLHTATLVHDDVVDNSDLRRGAATVNNMWTNKISVLVGDFLFSRTLITILDLRDQNALEIFSNAAKEITEGELLQIERSHDYEIDEEIYFDLITRKTASLFAASCELGALTVNGNLASREKMREFGRNLGIAFQIKDDLLDYVGNEQKLGKPSGNDVRENKVTLPLIYTLKHATPEQKEWILSVFGNDQPRENQIHQIIQLVNFIGGVEYSSAIARKYAMQAIEILNEFPDSIFKSSLKFLVEFTLTREN